MSDYDLGVHPFPPPLLYSQEKQQATTYTLEAQKAVPYCSPPCSPVPSIDAPKPSLLQVGGKHYKSMAIQPVEYNHANRIPFIEGSVIKYVSRWREKGGIQDLHKAKHFIDLLIELEMKHEVS